MSAANVYSAREPKRRFDLEVAARLRVEDHGLLAPLAVQRAQVRQRCALRVFRVLQQAAGGADARRRVLGIEARKIERAELLAEQPFAGAGIEMPRRPAARAGEAREPRRRVDILRQQQLGRLQALDLGLQRVEIRELRETETAAREIEPREPDARRERHGREQPRFPVVEQRRVGQGAGRDDADDFARDGAFARRGIADLLADRDGLAEPHEPPEVGLHGVHGHAGHRNRLAARLAAARQRDVDELGRAPSVVVEELVEVAHAIEQQRIGEPRLDGVVLLHDRRVRGSTHPARGFSGAAWAALIVVIAAEKCGGARRSRRYGSSRSCEEVIRTQVQPVSLHTLLSDEPGSARL